MKSYSEQVAEILQNEIGEVLASPILILQLLSVYSVLYLQGKNPGLCTRCHKDYYYKLKQTGMKKAQDLDDAKNRTCQPKWKGLKFINKVARHFNDALLTDKQAVTLLDAGLLKPEDFVRLPEGYGKEEDPAPVVEAAPAPAQKASPKPRKPRKK